MNTVFSLSELCMAQFFLRAELPWKREGPTHVHNSVMPEIESGISWLPNTPPQSES